MSFSKDVNDFILKTGEANETIIRSTVLQLWAGIIKSSPADTGRFRSNWFPSDGTPSNETTTDRNAGSITRAAKSVFSQRNITAFTLTNNLPYADVIEFGGYKDGPNTSGGYSRQAPSGVVRVNVKRFNGLIRNNAARFKV